MTGGVITSAGVVLAATFTVLGVLPWCSWPNWASPSRSACCSTPFIVRTILVPALAHDIGRKIWWPSKLAVGAE